MATHSSILAWEISWTEEPGGLQSMGSQRVRHDLAAKQHRSALEITHKWVGQLTLAPWFLFSYIPRLGKLFQGKVQVVNFSVSCYLTQLFMKFTIYEIIKTLYVPSVF